MKVSKRRLFWLVIILTLLVIYLPINHLVTGGWALSLPIDKYIPLYPPALIPYLIGSFLFVAFPICTSLYSEKYEFEAYIISFLTATIISYIIYLTLPTFVIRPEVHSQDYFSKAIVLLYQNDYPHNAAPSGHTFYTLISFLYINRWMPRLKIISLIVAILIIASTLLTKQHNVLDVIAGFLLGLLAYWVGRNIQSKWNLMFASR
jgi:membrane-associated phospholipid phosphatase